MRRNLTRAVMAALALFVAAPAFADGPGTPEPNVAAPPVRAAPITPPANSGAAPVGRTGVIPLGADGLVLNVPTGYRFYAPPEARAYLQRANASVPPGEIYGLVARRGEDIRAAGAWATVISYDNIGYVELTTASGLSDTNFEEQVRSARQTQNRRFESFATEPSFNLETPYLLWAENVAAPGGATGKDLRYEQKILGRSGVVGMTSIGSADQLPQIAEAAAALRGMLTFPEGKRHADFAAASDQVSDYSVPGLITGIPTTQTLAAANAADTGTGQTAFGGLAGYFPWIALGVVVLAGAGYMLMRRRNDDDDLEEA